MKIQFEINYKTSWGQQLFISGSLAALGKWESKNAASMQYVGSSGDAIGKWVLEIEIPQKKVKDFSYKYFVREEQTQKEDWEWGENRAVFLASKKLKTLEIKDFWRPQQELQNIFFTSAFTKSLMKRNNSTAVVKSTIFEENPIPKANLRLQVYAPKIDSKHKIALLGSSATLGKWEEKEALILDDSQYPLWKIDLHLKPSETPFQYKYVVYDEAAKIVISWELGENRYFFKELQKRKEKLHIWADNHFRYQKSDWRGAGVAIPVFSLRSEKGAGIGEFNDLKLLVDWSVKTGLKMIQILPINDTSANSDWNDACPYSAISAFALHPIYLHLETVGTLKSAQKNTAFETKRQELNNLEAIAFSEVMQLKMSYLQELFQEQKTIFLKSTNFQKFFQQNKNWLLPYACFCYLRDKKGTSDFNQWGKFAKVSVQKLEKLAAPKSTEYEKIAFYYFLQFHLDKQLLEVANYAREKGIVLKGDIPIGVSRQSVDVWIAPHLYNLETQTGAPPDDFSAKGQNWNFPTYNWDAMAKDEYAWWRRRLQKMSGYFDAFRIDHILGFFRIWEIPYNALEGVLGYFNPAISLEKEELINQGLDFDYNRFCKPYIKEHFLEELFGEHIEFVKDTFLQQNENPESYELKLEFNNQRGLEALFSDKKKIKKYNLSEAEAQKVKEGLFKLTNEVLFLETPFSTRETFEPRILIQETRSYQELDTHSQQLIDQIYDDYFYKRNDDFWEEEALKKLPIFKTATNMLVCGEDLGMVPACVPKVMNQLSILNLAIQRMPSKVETEFWKTEEMPYLSVCSTSSHDMSTLRAWWEENEEASQRFFNIVLGNEGTAPKKCEPWICKQIISQHLHAPTMWAIFPIQDLLALDEQLQKENPKTERINNPSDTKEQWKYRFHINLETLLEEENFNSKLEYLISDAGRDET